MPEDALPVPPADGAGPADAVREVAVSGPSSRVRMFRSLAIGLAIVVVVVLLISTLGRHSGGQSARPKAAVGSEAPGFSLPPLTGSAPVTLAALGKDVHRPVVLNFFASWCTPCQRETPVLAQASSTEQATGGPVQFVGVDVNDPPANARPFALKSGIAYPVGMDESFQVSSGRYGLYGLPQTFYIAADGTVLGHTIGEVTAAELHSWLEKLDRSGSARRTGA